MPDVSRKRSLIIMICFALPFAIPGPRDLAAAGGTVSTVTDRAQVERQTRAQANKLSVGLRKLRALAKKPMPAGLSNAQMREWRTQTKWIKSVIARYSAHAKKLRRFAVPRRGTAASGGGGMIQEMANTNMQFLALQNAMQRESRKYQALSNASKARHDLAKRTIRNMK